MRKGFLAAVASLLASSGVTFAQGWPGGWAPYPYAYPAYPAYGTPGYAMPGTPAGPPPMPPQMAPQVYGPSQRGYNMPRTSPPSAGAPAWPVQVQYQAQPFQGQPVQAYPVQPRWQAPPAHPEPIASPLPPEPYPGSLGPIAPYGPPITSEVTEEPLPEEPGQHDYLFKGKGKAPCKDKGPKKGKKKDHKNDHCAPAPAPEEPGQDGCGLKGKLKAKKKDKGPKKGKKKDNKNDRCDPCEETKKEKDDPYEAKKKSRFWVGGDYLIWWVKGPSIPFPLVTTGSASSLGLPGAGGVTLIGDGHNNVDFGTFAGMRLDAGLWLNECRTLGFEADGLLLEQRSDLRSAVANPASPALGRPFINAVNGLGDIRLLSLPGAFDGRVDTKFDTRLWGAEANPFARVINTKALTADVLTGFRYLDLEESLEISDSRTVLGGGVTSFNGAGFGPGVADSVVDRFDTRNQFYGGQLGTRVRYTSGKWAFDATGKVALGVTHEVVQIGGSSALVGGGPAIATVPGGLLAVSSNAGRLVNDEFSVLPEVSLKVIYRLSPAISLRAGYTFLYLSNVARPGDQADRLVNTTLVPTSPNFGVPFGPARPASFLDQTSFYAHGVDLGVGFSF